MDEKPPHPVIWVGLLRQDSVERLVVYGSRNHDPFDMLRLYVVEMNDVQTFKKSEIAHKLRKLPRTAEEQRAGARVAYGRYLDTLNRQDVSANRAHKPPEGKEPPVDEYLSKVPRVDFNKASSDLFRAEDDRYFDD